MKQTLLTLVIAALFFAVQCGDKDDGLLLLPFGAAGSQSEGTTSPADVPQGDLQADDTSNVNGGGTVMAITGNSATPASGGGDKSSTSGGDSGSTGGDSGSTAGGDSGSTGGDSGSTAGGDSGSTSTGTSTGTGTTSSGSTTASKLGAEYDYVNGTWYRDGTAVFTYEGDKAIGYNFSGMEPGLYEVTITVKHWVKSGSSENLPDGYQNFNVSVAAGGSAQTLTIGASSTDWASGTVQLNLGSDPSVLLNFLNPSCGTEGGYGEVGDRKTAICHIPPGNPEQKHTIVVGNSAIDAHQKNHGDSIGACSVCVNLEIASISIKRVGDSSSLTAFLGQFGSFKSTLIAGFALVFSVIGVLMIQRWSRTARQS